MDFLSKFFPRSYLHFVDVFGGSASVILNVHDYKLKTYNDINSDLVNFFSVLRSREDELIDVLEMTPYSREEFDLSKMLGDCDDLEKARRFFVLVMQARNSQTNNSASWGFDVGSSSSRISKAVSKFINSVSRLRSVAKLLRMIQIENCHWEKIVNRYDEDTTLFYLDPPYLKDVRTSGAGYSVEMYDNSHHENLADVLNNIKGGAVVSGYKSELYDRIFAGWTCVLDKERFVSASNVSYPDVKMSKREEAVWYNKSVAEHLEKDIPTLF